VGFPHLTSEPTGSRVYQIGSETALFGSLKDKAMNTTLPPKPLVQPIAEVRIVDAKARVLLPKNFAGSTVVFEMINDTEILIRKAVVVPEASLPTIEDTLKPLSNEDRDFFLNLIDNPPEPNEALRKAAARYKKRYG
jgi:hypothetical protein